MRIVLAPILKFVSLLVLLKYKDFGITIF
jgi:hypothetical protein